MLFRSICFQMTLTLTTYKHGKDLPDLPGSDVFQSQKLFLIYEATPGYSPYLIVARNENNEIIAYLLSYVRKVRLLFPPFLFHRCEIYGNGEYNDGVKDKEYVFGQMLKHLTKAFSPISFIIEFRNLGNALWGYRYFR